MPTLSFTTAFLEKKGLLVISGLAIGYTSASPLGSKTVERVMMALTHFFGHARTHELCTSRAPELIAAIWAEPSGPCPRRTGIPGVAQTNGIAESRLETVMPGARALSLQAGLPRGWWPYLSRCFAATHSFVTNGNGPANFWPKLAAARPTIVQRLPNLGRPCATLGQTSSPISVEPGQNVAHFCQPQSKKPTFALNWRIWAKAPFLKQLLRNVWAATLSRVTLFSLTPAVCKTAEISMVDTFSVPTQFKHADGHTESGAVVWGSAHERANEPSDPH